MKRILLALIAIVLVLGACGGNSEDDEDVEKSEESTDIGNGENGEDEEDVTVDESDEGSVEVDKGLFDVEVTIPASLVEGEDLEQIIADAEAEGVSEVVENDDGSLTYQMSKSTHKDMMKDMAEEIEVSMDEMKSDEEFVSIQDITANDSYSEFTMVVDEEAFENSFDGFAAIGLAFSGLFYQLFDGVDPDDYEVVVQFENADTGDVFDTVVYPDAFDEMGDE